MTSFRTTRSLTVAVPCRQAAPNRARKQAGERGFALLAIFLMAAIVALMLFVQLPRVAFESEREKEQILIDRGEQYIRAIKLYTKDYGKFPGTLKELEETNRKRYLRRMYLDPFTGKDEWRLVHSNGSQLTDSLVEKPPLVDGATPAGSTTNNTQQNLREQINAAVLQRSSDMTLPGNEAFNQTPGQPPNQQLPPLPNGLPGAIPGGVQVGNPQLGFPGQQFPGQQFPGQQFPGQALPPGVQPFPNQPQNQGKALPGQPASQTPQFQPQFPGQQFIGQQFAGQPPPPGFQIGPNGQLIPVAPGTPPTAGFSFNQFPNQMPGQGAPGQPGQRQQNPLGANGLPPSNPSAANIVNQLLTGPNNASPVTSSILSQTQNSAAAGIAGVASTHTGPTIKVYNDRTKYEEWEFVYTPTAPLTGVAPGSGSTTNPQNPNDPRSRTTNPNQPPNNQNPFGKNPPPTKSGTITIPFGKGR